MDSTVKVRVTCPGCGPLVVPAADVRCELEANGSQGICELRCPICSTTVLAPAAVAAVETMRGAGAGHISGSVPFELLEIHAGPPLSWDDLLDFKLALDGRSEFLSDTGDL